MLCWNISVFLLSSLFSLSTQVSQEQKMPQSYMKSSNQGPSRQEYETWIKSTANNINAALPTSSKDLLRMATYNIHFHYDLDKKNVNTQMVQQDLKNIEADVVAFEEVHPKGRPNHEDFLKMLKLEGYNHILSSHSTPKSLGNVIASRFPLKLIGEVQLGHKRTLLAAAVEFKGKSVALLATHLEVGDHTSPASESQKPRLEQMKMIIDFISKNMQNNYDQFYLMGDFNAQYDEACFGILRDVMVESFSSLSWQSPNTTCWAGTTIDFIFANKEHPGIHGSYIYHSLASDHLPVIVDVRIDEESGSNVEKLPSDKDEPSFVSKHKITIVVGISLTITLVAVIVIKFVF